MIIHKSVIDYVNKQTKKNILIVTNEDLDITYLKTKVNIMNQKDFMNHYPKNAYHYILAWDCLCVGSPLDIFSLLAKMNHNLRDDGEILVTVLKNTNVTEANKHIKYFIWDNPRIKAIGWSKGLKVKNKIKQVKIDENKYLRFSYIPS
tara:strand:- start:3071 stop:3514 length:444 start_codon:yes stop_codon:yes gene_type:complete